MPKRVTKAQLEERVAWLEKWGTSWQTDFDCLLYALHESPDKEVILKKWRERKAMFEDGGPYAKRR